jgi:hypothetical protein
MDEGTLEAKAEGKRQDNVTNLHFTAVKSVIV